MGLFLQFLTVKLFSFENSPLVRILLAKNIHSIQVSSSNKKKKEISLEFFSPKGELKKKQKIQQLTLCSLNKNNEKKLKKYTSLIYRLKSIFPIYWEEKLFRGDLLVYKSTTGNYCDLVNVIHLEQYLQWLLAKEMHPDWPIEALKAQAIAARSYTLNRINHNIYYSTRYYDLENSQKDQVSGDARDENENTFKAIMETLGLVLVSSNTNSIIPGFFHSKCGGSTLVPHKIWPSKIQEIVGVKCPYCHTLGMGSWIYYSEKNQLLDTMKKLLPNKKPLFTLSQNDSVNNHTFFNIKKSSIRNIIGTNKVPSNQYKIEVNPNHDQIKFIGIGHGHGVGLCQFGALKMAQLGKTAPEIVEFYFPKLRIQRRYE